MNKIFKIIALSVIGLTNVHATSVFQVGDYEINARMAINVTSGADTFGIGRVNTISLIGGTTFWSAGDNGDFLNFNFSGYDTLSTDPVTGDFAAENGNVSFWMNDSDLYNTSISFADTVDLQDNGILFLVGLGSGITEGTTVPTSYRANGFLDVIGGAAFGALNTDGLINLDGGIADMSFNLSGSNFDNQFYDYAGSADGTGTASPVPVPPAAMLFMTGLLGLTSLNRVRRI